MTDSSDTRITYRAIQERAKECAIEAMPELPRIPEYQLYADSARGVYIPQHFAETVNRAMCDTPDDDLDLLAQGPDACESYWDIWVDVLDSCVLTDSNGQRWTLRQDGDLWLVPEGAYDAWDSFRDEVEDLDAYDIAHESADWDWVIYYHLAMEICQAVPSDVLHDAESEYDDMGMTQDEVSFYGLACGLAALIVEREIANAVEEVRSELLELAETQMGDF